MDDSLSAVDAYVGKSILENCILNGPLADKTRILVTHALHVLDKTDYIYVMDDGIVKEEGTYTVCDLMQHNLIQQLTAYISLGTNERQRCVLSFNGRVWQP